MNPIDQPGDVRGGEELDVAAVDSYLRGVLPDLSGTPAIRQFDGGSSNLTYMVSYPDRDLILRRPPFGHKAKSAHDMAREARVMTALKPVYSYVPQVIALCEDPSVMGCSFYVMERLRGIIPRKDLPEGLGLDAAATRRLCMSVVDRLIELHQVDPVAAGLQGLGKGEGYVRRQVEGWSDRFRKSRTEDVVDFESVMAWLAEKQPAGEVAIRVIHNDYRFDNVVLHPDRPIEVIGVLDWEMATLGDPLMDLGGSLAYWVEVGDDAALQGMRQQPTTAPGMFTRRELIDYYAERTGWSVDNFDFYTVFGLFRLAVIIQQIYYRFFHGQTTNPRFARFGQLVNYMDQRCRRFIGDFEALSGNRLRCPPSI